MGFRFHHLQANGNKIVVEREQNIFEEQNSNNYIKRSRTITRERYPAKTKQSIEKESPLSKKENKKFPLIVTKKLSLGKSQKYSDRPVDGPNSVEAEIEITLEAIIKSEQSQEKPNGKSIQAACERLGHLEASINHEISKLKQQRSELRMNISKQKNAKEIRQNVDGNVKVCMENERREIAVEKFSNKHQCVCTSPRYGGVEELSCRPRERTIASQMEPAPPIQDRGAVGDHLSLNNIPNESPKEEQSSKNDKNLNDLKDLLTAPDIDKNAHHKVNEQIVNYCYCHNKKVNHARCNPCQNNHYYQNTGTTAACYYNYYPNYQVDPCSSPNYCYTSTTVTQPTCRYRCVRRGAISCGRRRTDLETNHFYSPPSPSSKLVDEKCGKFDSVIKAQLEKELKAQLKSAREKERYKKRYKELCEKLREQERCEKKMREEEKKRCQSSDRQHTNQEGGNLCKKIFEKLQGEGTSKLIKLLDRYCDEKSEDKKKNAATSERCRTVRSRERVCQITVKKCKPRRTDVVCPNSEPVSVAKCYCPEYCIQKVECFDKKPTDDPQYSWETLQMLKKMKIKEYKAAKPKSPKPKSPKTKSDKQSPKDKQYNDYINKYKRADKQDTDTDSMMKHSKKHDLNDKAKRNKEEYQQSICCEEFLDICCVDENALDYNEFRTEMDKHLGVTSLNECSTLLDSARTYTKCKDEEVQAYCSADVSINSPNKARKALESLKDFLESFAKSCPKEDKELLDLQTAAAEILSKLATCKLKNLKTCQTQTEFKGGKSACAGVQTSHCDEDESKTNQVKESVKEFLESIANSCPKENEKLLNLQIKADKVMSKLTPSKLDNLYDCVTHAELNKGRESICASVQPSYYKGQENKTKDALVALREFLGTYANSCPKGDDDLSDLQVKTAKIMSELGTCKASETHAESPRRESICPDAQSSYHCEDGKKAKKALKSLNDFIGSLEKSCPKEDEKLLDLQITANKEISKLSACKARELECLKACKIQTEPKKRESICPGDQSSCHCGGKSKAKKALESINEFLDTFAKTRPKEDEDLLDLQIIAKEVLCKIAACKAAELENLKTCETRIEFKGCDNVCAGVQTSCHNIDEMQNQTQYLCHEETDLDLNLAIKEPPPLSHATYKDEYFCSSMPKYVSTDTYGGSHRCPDNKHFYDDQSVQETSINCNRNNMYPRSVSARNNLPCDLTNFNDSISESINQNTVKDLNFTNCASSTVTENPNQTTSICQPLCSNIATKPHDMINNDKGKIFQPAQGTPPLQSPCSSTCKSIRTCSIGTCASVATTSRNNSPCRSNRSDSPNKSFCKDNQSGRSILKSSPNITQRNECCKQQSATSMICNDKDNRSMRTYDTRSQYSQTSICSDRSRNPSVCSNYSQQERKCCTKCLSSGHISSKSQITMPLPAFNNCPCMQGVYYDILNVYFKGKERNLKKLCP